MKRTDRERVDPFWSLKLVLRSKDKTEQFLRRGKVSVGIISGMTTLEGGASPGRSGSPSNKQGGEKLFPAGKSNR